MKTLSLVWPSQRCLLSPLVSPATPETRPPPEPRRRQPPLKPGRLPRPGPLRTATGAPTVVILAFGDDRIAHLETILDPLAERSISDARTVDGLRPVENVPDFCCQHDLGQRLLKQRDAGIQPALMHDGIARISRHEKYPEVRLPVVQFVGQLAAVDAGHHDVGEKQIDPERIGIELRQRGRAVGRLADAVVQILQRFHQIGSDVGFVLDHQYGFASAAADHRQIAFPDGIGGDVRSGQIDLDRRPFADLAVDFDVPAGLSDEAIHLAQSEAGALPRLLAGKEWYRRSVASNSRR
jgi:hypothetical protein